MARVCKITSDILSCRSSVGNVFRHMRTSASLSTRSAEEKMTSLMQEQHDEIDRLDIMPPIYIRTKEGAATINLQEFGDKEILDFSKNSYLGIGRHPEVIKAANEAMNEFGIGIGSVRPANGTFALHKRLDRELTEFMERDPERYDTIVLPTGYHANLALFHVLCGQDDVIISDSLIHGTAIHGMALSKAKRVVFQNNDMEDLEKKLQANMDKRQRIIAADGVYSMDGFCSNLKGMRALADKYDALLMIDDAHGIGVVGEHGKGAEEYENAMNSCDIITASLCKGLTPAGGFILATNPLIRMLEVRSGSSVFSTALTPPNAAGVLKALEIARSEEGYQIRARLRENAKLFRKLMKEANFFVGGEDDMPICPVIFPHDMPFTLLTARELLFEHGILTLGVPVPSAPPEAPRIRVTMAGFHTEEHIRRLVDAFLAVSEKYGRTQ